MRSRHDDPAFARDIDKFRGSVDVMTKRLLHKDGLGRNDAIAQIVEMKAVRASDDDRIRFREYLSAL